MECLFPTSDQPLDKPVVIAGPCVAESFEMIDELAAALTPLCRKLDVDFVFKASFDKANRTSIRSYRGPGLPEALSWFGKLKEKHGCRVTTDVHETTQAAAAAEVCDVLQIPAFLCRQTDLIIAAVETGRAVSVKKGQFLAPENTAHIVSKVRSVCEEKSLQPNLALIERGSSFGYNNLVVDMRGLKTMTEQKVPVIFDITHSTQQPQSAETTGGLRHAAPLLARAACATGYLSGFFLEVHPQPAKAKSDATTQLSLTQAQTLLEQIIPLWRTARALVRIDAKFS